MNEAQSIETIDFYLQDRGRLILEESVRAGLVLPLACALIEQESEGHNVFGCDWGARWIWEPPFCQVPVTTERVAALLANIDDGGGENGVGLSQLTYAPVVRYCESLGGAHRPRLQLRVGFEILADYLEDYSPRVALGVYNGGPKNPNMAYADEVLKKRNEWRRRLA